MNFNKIFLQDIVNRGTDHNRSDPYSNKQTSEEESSCNDCHSLSRDTSSFFDAGEFSQEEGQQLPSQTRHKYIDKNITVDLSDFDLTKDFYGGEDDEIDEDDDDPTGRLIHAIHALRETVLDHTSNYHQHGAPGKSHHSSGGGGQHHRGPAGRHHGHHHTNRRSGPQAGSGYQEEGADKTASQDERTKKKKERVVVEVRVVFLKIGEIDTLKEIYHADAFIQAKWREPKLDNQTAEELNQHDLDKFWSPLLFIDNILNESKDQYWIAAQTNEKAEVTIVERRRIKGVFLETLELNDFPLDVQDLTITITSERPDTEIDLIPDNKEISGINIGTFVDQQEWRLHEHIEISKRSVTQEYTSSMRSHPCLSVTCRAARRPGYFYWNVFLIMFFITGLSFATFALPPDRPENRLQLSFTLFLTSVAFKFVINQSLPKISYLTYMDKYVLMSLAILCIVSIWHAVVTLVPKFYHLTPDDKIQLSAKRILYSPAAGGLGKAINGATTAVGIISKSLTNGIGKLPPPRSIHSGEQTLSSFVKKVEWDVFITFCTLYFLAHMVFIFWLYFDASKRRRDMCEKDRQYRQTKLIAMV